MTLFWVRKPPRRLLRFHTNMFRRTEWNHVNIRRNNAWTAWLSLGHDISIPRSFIPSSVLTRGPRSVPKRVLRKLLTGAASYFNLLYPLFFLSSSSSCLRLLLRSFHVLSNLLLMATDLMSASYDDRRTINQLTYPSRVVETKTDWLFRAPQLKWKTS